MADLTPEILFARQKAFRKVDGSAGMKKFASEFTTEFSSYLKPDIKGTEVYDLLRASGFRQSLLLLESTKTQKDTAAEVAYYFIKKPQTS